MEIKSEERRAKSKELIAKSSRLKALSSMLLTLCSLLYALCSPLYALRSVLYALFSMLLALCLSGCGYTIHGKTSLPFNEIYIERIENKTLEPKLQDRFHRVMAEEFLKQGININSDADYKLSGTIDFFEINVLAERNVAVEYEVVMRGDFKLIGPSGYIKEMKGIGSPFIVSFPGSGMLEDVLAAKELASEKALRDMATEIVGILIYSVKKVDFPDEGYR
jgi:hypothetical protein